MNDLKYTDRDVRENPDFYDWVVEYLEKYRGEFDFLIDMKMRLAQGVELSVGHVRGVLNCMRIDPRVTGLPQPKPPSGDAAVLAFEKPRPKKVTPAAWNCPLMEQGVYHYHKRFEPGMRYCSGLFRINRVGPHLPARIHDGLYVKGRSMQTYYIHKINHEHTYFSWVVPQHSYGWHFVELNVKVQCKMPSWLKNPVLMNPEHIKEFNREAARMGYETAKPCPRCCFSEDEVVW